MHRNSGIDPCFVDWQNRPCSCLSLSLAAQTHVGTVLLVTQAKGVEGSRSSWVAVLQSGAYRDLSTEQRVAALSALCHAVMEGPAVRAAMDARLDEAHNRRRLQHQETRARF